MPLSSYNMCFLLSESPNIQLPAPPPKRRSVCVVFHCRNVPRCVEGLGNASSCKHRRVHLTSFSFKQGLCLHWSAALLHGVTQAPASSESVCLCGHSCVTALAPPQKRAEEAPQWSEGLILDTACVSCSQRGHRPLQRDPQMPLNLGSQRREGGSLQVPDPTAVLISLHFLLS